MKNSICSSAGMPFVDIALVECNVSKDKTFQSFVFIIQKTIGNMSWQHILYNLLTVLCTWT